MKAAAWRILGLENSSHSGGLDRPSVSSALRADLKADFSGARGCTNVGERSVRGTRPVSSTREEKRKKERKKEKEK